MAESINPKSGRSFLLKVSDGTSPTTFSTVGGLRNVDMTINGRSVDVTNVESSGFQEMAPDAGVASVSISADGILDADDTILDTFEDAVLGSTGSTVECQIVSGKGDSYVGDFVVQQFRRTGAHDGVETFSLQLASDGGFVHSG